MQDKLLSIYIPTYNRAEKVVAQLNFILDEIKDIESDRVEIVVNNNCSTDDTEQRILDIVENTSVIYHKNTSNLGIVGNAYAAADLVHGKYFWLIGDDDILCPGIVERVYNIINSNPKISHVFLNYDICDIHLSAYDGLSGLIKNGAKYMTGEKVNQSNVLVLTTSNIYLKEALVKTVRELPLSTCESYGWSAFAAFTSMKMGYSYFDNKVWMHNDAANMSWKDIVCEANMGRVRMYEKLKRVGYTRREISMLYRQNVDSALLGKVIYRFLLSKDYKVLISDILFCFRKVPVNTISICFSLLYEKIKTMKVKKI